MEKQESLSIELVGSDPKYGYRSARNAYSPKGVSPCLPAAMGGGGGFVPMVVTWKKKK